MKSLSSITITRSSPYVLASLSHSLSFFSTTMPAHPSPNSTAIPLSLKSIYLLTCSLATRIASSPGSSMRSAIIIADTKPAQAAFISTEKQLFLSSNLLWRIPAIEGILMSLENDATIRTFTLSLSNTSWSASSFAISDGVSSVM